MRTSLSSIRIIQRQSFLFIIPLILIFAFTACGSNGGTGAGGSTPTAAPTATTVTGIGGTPEGCPSNSAPNTSQQKPDVTIQLKDTNSNITAHTNNLIEVRLPFGQMWSGPATSQGVLQLQQPAGYASQADKMCIWHFIAQGTGTTQLTFTARAICQKGQLCPQYIRYVPFTVDVK